MKNCTVETFEDGYRAKYESPHKNEYGLSTFICYGYGNTEDEAMKDLEKNLNPDDEWKFIC